MTEPSAEVDDPGLMASVIAMLRLMTGWACTTLGLLNLAMGVDTGPGSTDGPYLLFHAMLTLTGLGLLALGGLRKRPGRAAYLTGAAVTVTGLVLSAVPATDIACCMREFPVRHGFPFTMLAGGDGRWHVDAERAIADLIFWSGAGFIALLLVTQLRSVRRAAPPEHGSHHATHAEQRATAPDDENVGGLP
jgi:hypothetical protein